MLRMSSAGFALVVSIVLLCAGCGGRHDIVASPEDPGPAPQMTAGWPAGLPVDVQQPWEQLDDSGYLIPAGRTANCINADSTLCCGVERDAASAAGVSDNGEAARLVSGDAGAGGLSWAYWRLELGGEQPGAVSADVNLLPMSDGGRSAYYLGLSDYGAGGWQWHGPFGESHVRLSTAADLAAGSDFLSEYGNLFICLVATGGATFDVVGVAANCCDAGDSEAPAAPTGLTATAVAGGVELAWDEVATADLAGYRVYHATSWFLDASATGVKALPTLEGLTHCTLAAGAETHVRVGAVDLSGNESALSDIASAVPLAGAPPDVRLTASAPSGLTGAAITLTASGADEYDWDLDGDGTFELTGVLLANADVDTSRAGFIRPMVRGLLGGGSCRACGGVSVLIGTNSRPLADGHADPSSGYAPLSVTFTGTGEDDDGTIAQYSWDFEDDGSYDYTHATEPDPPVHVYTTPGTYNAKFRVEDNLGLTDVDTVAVSVSDPLNDPPTAALAIGAGEERGNPPHTVNFDASGSMDTDGSIVEYLWDFDSDGHYDYSSTAPAAVHTYTQSGAYTAAVRVEDNDGGRDSETAPVEVNLAPVAAMDADVTSGDPPLAVSFDASGSTDSDGTIEDYEWDLDGDGVFNESGDEADARGSDTASYSYGEANIFEAELRVTDNEGMQDTETIAVTATGWRIILLEPDGHAGTNTALLIVDGSPAIAYCKLTSYMDYNLKYARASTAKGLNPTDWTMVTVDCDGNIGDGLCMAVVDGCPAIAYVDEGNDYVKYARATTSTGDGTADWTQKVTVDDNGNVCYAVSLAVVDGSPAIAYQDYTNNYLKYARATTSTGESASDWTQNAIVDSGNVGHYCSLAVIDGCPAISHYNDTLYDLKYARATTSTGGSASDWTQLVTVDSSGDVGGYNWLAVIDGCPAISYYDDTNGNLKYARATTSTGSTPTDWSQIVTVDSSDDEIGRYTSLAVVNGNPAISYFDSTNRDLKYARATTSTGGSASDWTQIEVVDSDGMVGAHNSMATVDGSPAIAYGDWDYNNLKYAYYVQ